MLENKSVYDIKPSILNIINSEEFEVFLDFASSFVSNFGTYDYYEQTNFTLPFELAFSIFESIYCSTLEISTADLLSSDPSWKKLTGTFIDLFSWTPDDMKIFSSNCSVKDIMDVNEYLLSKGKTSLNTRIEKQLTIENCYDIHFGQTENIICYPVEFQTKSGKRIIVRPLYDMYFQSLNLIVEELQFILKIQNLDKQLKDVITLYINYFKNGDVKEHRKARDISYKSKIVFSTGFIERQWDRTRTRGLFRTFIGIRNDSWDRRLDSLTKNIGYLSNLIPNCNIDYNLNLNEKGTEVIFMTVLRYGPGTPYYALEDACRKIIFTFYLNVYLFFFLHRSS